MLALALLAALAPADDGAAKLDAAALAALKKKLAGKLSIDRKTGLLQLAYDFHSSKQASDFLVKEKPAETSGGLLLRPGVAASHVVPWRSVAIECQVQVAKMSGYMLTAEHAKTSLSLGGSQFNTLYLRLPKRSRSVVVPKDDRSGLKTIRFEIDEGAALAGFDKYCLSERTDPVAAGRIEFNGGSYGFAFTAIAFRGLPDPDWLKELVEGK